MTTLTIHTDTAAHARKIASLLKDIPYVKDVKLSEEDAPLKDSDWIKPGRPATEAEIEALILKMEEPQATYTVAEARSKTLNEIKAWRAKKSK